MSPRYVLMLVGQLSDDSAFAASVRGGPEFRSWSFANSVAVANANLLHAANQQRAGKKSIKPLIKPPTRKPKRKVMRVAEILARQREAESTSE